MPSKFKIKLKLTGLELEVEGSREDIPLINNAIGNQIAGLLSPTTQIVEGDVQQIDNQANASEIKIEKPSTKKRPRTKPQSTSDQTSNVIALKHDFDQWGTPQQDWSAADKSIWLLYVVDKQMEIKELTSGQIISTFETHFRQAKISKNIPRDLGKLKTQTPTLIAEDANKSPHTWYLTQAGIKYAESLIQKALGQSPSSNGQQPLI